MHIIEFIKLYISTPQYLLTPLQKFYMSLIIITLIFIVSGFIYGVQYIINKIKTRIDHKKNKKKKNKEEEK